MTRGGDDDRGSVAMAAQSSDGPGLDEGPRAGRSPGGWPGQRGVRSGILAAAILFLVAAVFTPSAKSLNALSIGGRGAALLTPWDSFYSVAFLPSGKCYVVGAQGALLTSTDGGGHWTRSKLAERGDLSWFDLYSIRFAADGRAGWISGEGGLILHTADGGETWRPQQSGTSENLFRIAAADPRHAYATGTNGVMMRTDDGGEHWQAQRIKGGLIFFDIAFADAQNGWAVGEFATILHTVDGGRTWVPQMGGTRSNFRLPALFAIGFSDLLHGVAAGQGGTLFSTSDGGKSWQQLKAPISEPVYSVAYDGQAGLAPAELWATGDGGMLLRMALGTDGAGAQTTVQEPTVFSLSDIAFHGQTGIAVGL